MAHIKTASGFEADINEEALDDYRLMKAVRAAQTGDTLAVVDVVSLVLGDDEDRLITHVVETTGRASMEAINAEMTEIFSALGEAKKK